MPELHQGLHPPSCQGLNLSCSNTRKQESHSICLISLGSIKQGGYVLIWVQLFSFGVLKVWYEFKVFDMNISRLSCIAKCFLEHWLPALALSCSFSSLQANEPVAATLMTVHNLHHMNVLMAQTRRQILDGLVWRNFSCWDYWQYAFLNVGPYSFHRLLGHAVLPGCSLISCSAGFFCAASKIPLCCILLSCTGSLYIAGSVFTSGCLPQEDSQISAGSCSQIRWKWPYLLLQIWQQALKSPQVSGTKKWQHCIKLNVHSEPIVLTSTSLLSILIMILIFM